MRQCPPSAVAALAALLACVATGAVSAVIAAPAGPQVFAIVADPRGANEAPFLVAVGVPSGGPSGPVRPALEPTASTASDTGLPPPVAVTLPDPTVSKDFTIDRRVTGGPVPPTPTARVRATLAMRTAHVDLWIDDALDASSRGQLLVPAVADALERAFVVTTGVFGPLRYPSAWNDPKERACEGERALAVEDGRARVIAIRRGIVESGYADLASYFLPACYPHMGVPSNGLAGEIVMPFSDVDAQSAPDVPTGVVETIAHELQHHVNYLRHDMGDDDAFMNEGLSMLAQDLAVGDNPAAIAAGKSTTRYDAQRFFAAPDAYDLLHTFGSASTAMPSHDRWGAYGAAYLLQRFLYDAQGPAYLRRIRADRHNVGTAELEAGATLPLHTVLVAFASALWSGHAAPNSFEALRGACARSLGAKFLHVQTIAPGIMLRVLPGSISFWRSADGIPSLRPERPDEHVVVVPLPSS